MIEERIRIPYHYTARPYQLEFLREVQAAIEGRSEKRYFYHVWHRRAGKDKTDIADPIPSRLIEDPCLVKMVYPTMVMARDNMWDGIGGDGFRYIEHIPRQLRVGHANETTMKIPVWNKHYSPEKKNNSLFQLAGANRPDSLRGGNPKLVVFSEWADMDPYAWDVVEPILKENDGIAIFNTTPKGDNHARALLEYAKNNPKWYLQTLSARDTGIWSLQELDEIRQDIIKRFAANGRSEEEAIAYFNQEYMCSFDAPVVGSYYGAAMQIAAREGRITDVPYYESEPVHTFWDLGMDDSMTIWFMQHIGARYHLIDYYESSGEGFEHYAGVLQKKRYLYGRHYAPHDIMVRELGTGKSRYEVAGRLGIRFIQAPKLPVDEGINATRSILRRCVFDQSKCHRGINCLKNYKKDWNEKDKVFRLTPKHDWASHGADAFRILGTAYAPSNSTPPPTSYGGVKPYIPGIA